MSQIVDAINVQVVEDVVNRCETIFRTLKHEYWKIDLWHQLVFFYPYYHIGIEIFGNSLGSEPDSDQGRNKGTSFRAMFGILLWME
ncbi:hypothetical protein CHS0354_021950 [Potamilus streckersoni]|uniref:Uncharacterized protein n=1 Tax=Potamilus streckersoni TaxID=2493646 RepID=A0AAE0SL33_9BIVA|nr:hypothetical protein CHS0354_021950 [Potamilus streckersoni]